MLVLSLFIQGIRKANRGISTQVPYRQFKLTEISQDCFEPCANISAPLAQFDDTLLALQFAAETVECHIRTGDLSDDDARILVETEARKQT
jgi:hypothetical protein